MIERPVYLDFLKRHTNTDVIKILTGVRRSGKSTIFALYQDYLIANGVKEENIITINFEDLAYFEYRHFLKLNEYIEKLLVNDQMYYIFFDEIQHVEQFELVVNSLRLKKNVDLYLTGSNAYYLSSDLATNITGRYVEKEVLPISFLEYDTYSKKNKDMYALFDDYFYTAFPMPLLDNNIENKKDFLVNNFNTIVLKDVLPRVGAQEVDDIERIARVMFSSIGSIVSINKISNTLQSLGKKQSHASVEKIVNGLLDGFLFFEVPRYNIKGRELLKRTAKYYCVDLGLRRVILPDAREDYGNLLENIVYLELRRRYDKVYVGAFGEYEVDFVAIKDNLVEYFQVSLSLNDEAVFQREIRSLRMIKDNYKKTILSMDHHQSVEDGIYLKNIIKWLNGSAE